MDSAGGLLIEDMKIKGNTYQEGDVSVENPVELECVLGENVVYVRNKNLSNVENEVACEEQLVRITLQKEMYKNDYLAEDGEHHLMKKMVLNGTENWKIVGKEAGYEDKLKTFYLERIADMKNTNFNYVQENVWCNWCLCGKYSGRNIARGLYENVECGGRAIYVCFEKFKDYTLDEFKAYLAEQYENGTPLEIVYELENEEVLTYTEEQQEGYEQMKKLRTYKGITHIDSEGAGAKAIFSFKYKKDLGIENEKIKARLDEIEALLSTSGTSALLLDNLENDLKGEVM